MNEGEIIRRDSSLVKSVEKAIKVTNNLLILRERRKVIDFFISHPVLFKKHISHFYSLSVNHLKKYRMFWDWSRYGISGNENIKWNEGLLDEFKSQLNWQSFTSNKGVPWTTTLIDKYEKNYFDKCAWANLGTNRNLPFSEELLDRYIDKWDFKLLSGNRGIPWTEHLVNKHRRRIEWNFLSENTSVLWSECLIDKYLIFWNWYVLAGNSSFNWNDAHIFKKYKEYISLSDLASNTQFNWSFRFIEEFDLDSWDWCNLCWYLPIWDIAGIERFASRIDFDDLSHNANLQWSAELIDRYSTKWTWRVLSGNPALPLSSSFIEKYINLWDWDTLSTNPGLAWSTELLEHFNDWWNWKKVGYLSWHLNSAFWAKGLQPFVDDDLIEEVIRGIIKKYGPKN